MSLPRPAFKVLLVDDDGLLLETLADLLRAAGITNLLTRTTADGLFEATRKMDAGVVLLDLTLPGTSGKEALADMSARAPEVPVIVVTGNSEVAMAVDCMRMGAFDYLTKPMTRGDLVASVRRAVELAELRREKRVLSSLLWEPNPVTPGAFSTTITRDHRMIALLRYAESVASTGHAVLITGETGTGKELIARSLHDASARAGPFVAINLAGVDDAMLADTMFGHVKGAYTGAESARRGMVENAANGTLFLDEIGDLSPTSQIKLLRLVEAREYLPLGAEVSRHSDAAIVVATNRRLEDAVEAGDFRRDLYYRLRTHTLHLPPLRDRSADVEPLLEHFVAEAALNLGVERPRIPPGALSLLRSYAFPGNVRELRALAFDAMSRCPSNPLDPVGLRAMLGGDGGGDAAGERDDAQLRFPDRLPTLQEIGMALEDEALARTSGNQTAAARLLGIAQPALSKRLRRRHRPFPEE